MTLFGGVSATTIKRFTRKTFKKEMYDVKAPYVHVGTYEVQSARE